VTEGTTGVRTFLIADVRGYSRFTDAYGDEAAARLAAKFADLVADEIQAHAGSLVELRGDEALAVFTSARQAIRAAVELQALFDAETEEVSELPLRVGIGIDSGEAIQLEDGSFRGSALNVAARLCGRAHAGEVIVSEATTRMAGRLEGLHYTDRGRVHLKNIADPVHVLQVSSELAATDDKPWVLMFFGKPGRTLGWKLAAIVVAIAAATAGAVVYLTTSDHTDSGTAAPSTTETSTTGTPTTPTTPDASNAELASLVPASLWQDCRLQTVPDTNAVQTAVCLPANGIPDRWQISTYRDGAALAAAYASQLRGRGIERDSGKCNVFSWGGERPWLHGPGKPGGRVFCYFDGTDAVLVWSHERLGQATHRDILAIAREGGSDHVSLTRWWRPRHHLIGKIG
jgi:class 3 adenylate cyclase